VFVIKECRCFKNASFLARRFRGLRCKGYDNEQWSIEHIYGCVQFIIRTKSGILIIDLIISILQVRCDKYWPDIQQSLIHGLISIHTTEENRYASYSVRKFFVTNKEVYVYTCSSVICMHNYWLLIIYGFTSRSRFFHLYGEVTIAVEGLQF
jgi:hypothetical protein